MNARHSGRSYRVHCTECDRVIGVCDPYCSHCGAEQGAAEHIGEELEGQS